MSPTEVIAPVSTSDPNSASAPMLRGAGGMMNLDDSVYDRLLRERIIFLGQRGRRRDRQPDLRPAAAARRPRTPSATSTSTSTRPAARSPPAWRSTTRCSSSTATSPPSRMGLAASMGQFLLSAGTPGKRYALPHARIMMHQPSGRHRRHRVRHRHPGRAVAYTKRRMAELHRRSTPARRSSRSRRTPTATAGSPPRRPWSTASSTTWCSRAAMSDSANPVTDN